MSMPIHILKRPIPIPPSAISHTRPLTSQQPSHPFSTSHPCSSTSPFFNLQALSNSRESQHFSRERRIPRPEFSPQVQLLRASEVDPFAPVPGASSAAVAAAAERARLRESQQRGAGAAVAAASPLGKGHVVDPTSWYARESWARQLADDVRCVSAAVDAQGRVVAELIGRMGDLESAGAGGGGRQHANGPTRSVLLLGLGAAGAAAVLYRDELAEKLRALYEESFDALKSRSGAIRIRGHDATASTATAVGHGYMTIRERGRAEEEVTLDEAMGEPVTGFVEESTAVLEEKAEVSWSAMLTSTLHGLFWASPR